MKTLQVLASLKVNWICGQDVIIVTPSSYPVAEIPLSKLYAFSLRRWYMYLSDPLEEVGLGNLLH